MGSIMGSEYEFRLDGLRSGESGVGVRIPARFYSINFGPDPFIFQNLREILVRRAPFTALDARSLLRNCGRTYDDVLRKMQRMVELNER